MMKEKIFTYIKKKYKTSPEYLWKRYPDYAVFRHSDNNKWFVLLAAVLLTGSLPTAAFAARTEGSEQEILMDAELPEPNDDIAEEELTYDVEASTIDAVIPSSEAVLDDQDENAEKDPEDDRAENKL
jgi:hypothetical protein